MKKLLLASTSLFVLGSVSAMAADMPMKAAPYMAPVPVFSWTGCYIGLHGGGGFMRDTFSDHGTGGLAGGQLGCNYQDGNWVVGVEGEGSWSGIKGTFTESEGISQVSVLAIGTDREIFTTKNKWDASIAARAGITFDRTLIYGKAGWVWGKFDYRASEPACCGPSAPLETINGSATLNGLLVGIGIEHALTQNWTVKLEYDYLRFGSKAVGFSDCVSTEGCILSTRSQNADKQLFKVGFNYLFPVFGR